MSYVDTVLQQGERIRYRGRLHWLIFLRPTLALILGLGFLGWWRFGEAHYLLALLASVVFLITALILFVPVWIRRFGTEIAVTDRRIIYKTGLVQRHTVEINLDKVESIDVDQSVLGRLMGYGTITVRGVGQAIEPVRDVDRPLALRTSVMVH